MPLKRKNDLEFIIERLAVIEAYVRMSVCFTPIIS